MISFQIKSIRLARLAFNLYIVICSDNRKANLRKLQYTKPATVWERGCLKLNGFSPFSLYSTLKNKTIKTSWTFWELNQNSAFTSFETKVISELRYIFYNFFETVLWIRNYFFRIRIRIPFSAEFWIRIKKIVTDPDPAGNKFWIQFRIRP
jgi:hypothetical protein